jgi:hypothetical protein
MQLDKIENEIALDRKEAAEQKEYKAKVAKF